MNRTRPWSCPRRAAQQSRTTSPAKPPRCNSASDTALIARVARLELTGTPEWALNNIIRRHKRVPLRLVAGLEVPDGGEIHIHRSDDPRMMAREGLVGLGFAIEEAERLLAGVAGDTPELLLQQALKAARA